MRLAPAVLMVVCLAGPGCADTLDGAWKAPGSATLVATRPTATPREPAAIATPVLPVVVVTRGSPAPGATTAPLAAVSFKRDVAPLLGSRCAACHAPGGSGGLTLTTAGGAASYAAISASLDSVVAQLEQGSMPRGGTRFTASQIALLRQWQAAGAPNN